MLSGHWRFLTGLPCAKAWSPSSAKQCSTACTRAEQRRSFAECCESRGAERPSALCPNNAGHETGKPQSAPIGQNRCAAKAPAATPRTPEGEIRAESQGPLRGAVAFRYVMSPCTMGSWRCLVSWQSKISLRGWNTGGGRESPSDERRPVRPRVPGAPEVLDTGGSLNASRIRRSQA